MKKCNLTNEELKQKVLDNMNACYDEYKGKMLDLFPDQIWENSHEITLHRDLYTYMLYKIEHLPKSALMYMQDEDMFDTLKANYYEGDYKPHYTEYSRLLEDYIKEQKRLEKDGEME